MLRTAVGVCASPRGQNSAPNNAASARLLPCQFMISSESLKDHLESKLQLTGIQLGLHGSKRGIRENTVDHVVIGMIQRVEKLGSNLKPETFVQRNVLLENQIQVDDFRPDQSITPQVAEVAGAGIRKVRGVKPFGR